MALSLFWKKKYGIKSSCIILIDLWKYVDKKISIEFTEHTTCTIQIKIIGNREKKKLFLLLRLEISKVHNGSTAFLVMTIPNFVQKYFTKLICDKWKSFIRHSAMLLQSFEIRIFLRRVDERPTRYRTNDCECERREFFTFTLDLLCMKAVQQSCTGLKRFYIYLPFPFISRIWIQSKREENKFHLAPIDCSMSMAKSSQCE